MLDERSRRKESVTSGNMVQALKDDNHWIRDTYDPNRKAAHRQAEAVYYPRDFINRWTNNGWVEKEELHNKYVLTPKGRNIIDTFFVEKYE